MIKTKETYADSTVAMSIYNTVCRTVGTVGDPGTLLSMIKETAHPDLAVRRFNRVIKIMKEKGILVSRQDTLVPCDRKRRLIVQRDRSDAYTDEKGKVQGGWGGWLAQDQLEGLVVFKPMPPKVKKDQST